MAAPGEKSFCVLEYHTSKSGYCATYISCKVQTGCLCKQKSSGRPLTAEDDVERVRASFLRSPKKSTGTAAKELSMSKTTVWRVLRKGLVFSCYKCL
jgi:hypothetical protein